MKKQNSEKSLLNNDRTNQTEAHCASHTRYNVSNIPKQNLGMKESLTSLHQDSNLLPTEQTLIENFLQGENTSRIGSYLRS